MPRQCVGALVARHRRPAWPARRTRRASDHGRGRAVGGVGLAGPAGGRSVHSADGGSGYPADGRAKCRFRDVRGVHQAPIRGALAASNAPSGHRLTPRCSRPPVPTAQTPENGVMRLRADARARRRSPGTRTALVMGVPAHTEQSAGSNARASAAVCRHLQLPASLDVPRPAGSHPARWCKPGRMRTLKSQ
jgi:hypothetical protein